MIAVDDENRNFLLAKLLAMIGITFPRAAIVGVVVYFNTGALFCCVFFSNVCEWYVVLCVRVSYKTREKR